MNTLAETAMWQMMSLHGPVTVLFSNSSAKSYLAVHQIKDKSTRKMSIVQCEPFRVEKEQSSIQIQNTQSLKETFRHFLNPLIFVEFVK